MTEFDAIARYFAPLSAGAPGAFDLTDDAAVLALAPGEDVVISVDTTIQGVHARLSDPLDMIARKALRTALSDLAAKAARPLGYTLALSWPRDLAVEEMALIARGLAADQAHFELALLGGDTTVFDGPLTLTIGVYGAAPAGRMVRRAGAQVGDGLFVTGPIGDAGLGLAILDGAHEDLPEPVKSQLRRRYLLPDPRLGVRDPLRAHAHAAVDVSDGLLADVGHMARASGVGFEIDLAAFPFSVAAESWLARQEDRQAALVDLATSGDDYEVAFAAREADVAAFALAGCDVLRIGRAVAETGVRLVEPGGRVAQSRASGFTHF